MPVPVITTVLLTPQRAERRPLLVVGPSLGTSVSGLWGHVATLLADRHDVVGWDLPGHGGSAPTSEPFTVGELAAGVLAAVDVIQSERGESESRFSYAGDSVGGATGLQLALDAPHRMAAVAVVCSGAKIGDPSMWADRAETVRRSGTAVLVSGTAQRWFAPGFLDREPDAGARLLQDLRAADAEAYALVCEALAGFDVRARLPEITTPVLVVSGALDVAAPAEGGRFVAEGVRDGRYVELEGVAHQAPVEAPQRTADLLAAHAAGGLTQREVYAAGLQVRRDVLGAAHVDRATAAVDASTRDFQELITRYAWGTIWTRPGLDRRSRSMITITALVANGHGEELALHLRGALTNGLTRAEITEVLLQSAIYCGVPAANSAFRVAQEVFRSVDEAGGA